MRAIGNELQASPTEAVASYYAGPFSMPIVDGEVLHLPRS
jgi:hypothetical protein